MTKKRRLDKSMKKGKYIIEMDTPIGPKFGIMKVCISGSMINGTLNLLEHSEPFSGTININGKCEIFGQIITLLRTIEYKAVGVITEKTVELSLQGDRNVFRIMGNAVKESEVNE